MRGRAPPRCDGAGDQSCNHGNHPTTKNNDLCVVLNICHAAAAVLLSGRALLNTYHITVVVDYYRIVIVCCAEIWALKPVTINFGYFSRSLNSPDKINANKITDKE